MRRVITVNLGGNAFQLDEEAYDRATSVYFPERAVHMFPSELATGLCSLNPDVDRLVQSCLMEVTPRGDVVRYEMHDGIINSDARMTYTAVNAILTDRDPATIAQYRELVPMFELMKELFEVLNARRTRRGSVDFDLPEAQVELNEEGFIENIVASERNVAHRLIEEFMLLANETVAGHLESKGMPALLKSTVGGLGGMPAGGQCFACSTGDFEGLIAFLAGHEG